MHFITIYSLNSDTTESPIEKEITVHISQIGRFYRTHIWCVYLFSLWILPKILYFAMLAWGNAAPFMTATFSTCWNFVDLIKMLYVHYIVVISHWKRCIAGVLFSLFYIFNSLFKLLQMEKFRCILTSMCTHVTIL